MASRDQYAKRPTAHLHAPSSSYNSNQTYAYQHSPAYMLDTPERSGTSTPTHGGPRPTPGSRTGYAPAPLTEYEPTNPHDSLTSDYNYPSKIPAAAEGSRWNPRNWSTKRKLVVGALITIVVLIAVIVGAVEGTRNTSYPDYTPLNYTLSDTFRGPTFYNNFNYWDTYDPAQGFVHYDNPTDAVANNLTYYDTTTKTAVLRVDDIEENATTGRHSARVYSKNTYDDGLFLFDIANAPYGCATWPAVWLTNQANWPMDGEIDVIEAVNKAEDGNEMTLHTTKGCSMSNIKRKQTGTALQGDCYNGTNANAGCGVRAPPKSFGNAFNILGGGVYAMELRDEGIRMWLFYRSSIPSDITAGTPKPETWGEALADFPSTDCDMSSHFKNLSIVANIDVCGSWAGSTKAFSTQGGCPGTCEQYAAQYPESFGAAFWQFNYFKVFRAS